MRKVIFGPSLGLLLAMRQSIQLHSVLYPKRKRLIEQAPKLFSDARKDPHLERIAQLEQLVGRLTLELEILKKASSMLKGPKGGSL